ncbi:molybdate ABC transporter substrate-binding protein [Shewanella sp. AS16]|uniref:molybdate ABC transporter substrate-binding protein n=1 Tax=Shewanella sp. AS16 TaxID=2907625 RepID=UPI001F37226F|nr:molybdate ABC transporter substrate-binding protein [Shewanella sp. AS16]
MRQTKGQARAKGTVKGIGLVMALLLGILTVAGVKQCAAREKLLVFAAASLTDVMTEIGADFDARQGSKTVFSFAASSTLARQIALGAPAALFISANRDWMDYLAEKQAINKDSRRTLATNALVLIAPKASPLTELRLDADWDLAAALGDGRLAVGDPDHVPAGRYAKQALQHLGLWAQAEPRLARANNVRGALALVERGEARLGIVYRTDVYPVAAPGAGVKTLATFPQTSHEQIQYPVALVVGRDEAKTAAAFLAYLQTRAAKAVLLKHGFGVPDVD